MAANARCLPQAVFVPVRRLWFVEMTSSENGNGMIVYFERQ